MRFRFIYYFLFSFLMVVSSGLQAQEKTINEALLPIIDFILQPNTIEDINGGTEDEVFFSNHPLVPRDFEGKYYLTINTDFDSEFNTDLQYIYTQLNSNVEIEERFSNRIRVSVRGGGLVGTGLLFRTEDFIWEMTSPIDGPEQGRLTERVVDSIQTSATFDNTQHRLNVSGNGSGCSPRSGNFRIFSVVYSEDDTITRLLADFQFNCFGQQMSGSIIFDDSKDDAVLPDVIIPQLPTFPALPELDSRGAVLVINGSDDTPIIRSEGLFLDRTNSTFTIAPIFGSTSGVRIMFIDDQNDFYTLDLEQSELAINPLLNQPLSVGIYSPATRAAFSSPLAGLSFSGAGSGCNRSGGRFSIYEVEFNAQGDFVKLVADFEMTCTSRDEPLRGSVIVDLTLPE